MRWNTTSWGIHLIHIQRGFSTVFFLWMFTASKHAEYCSLRVTRKVSNSLSGKLAHRCVKEGDWSWKGTFGFGFAFNDTISFGLMLKLAALPRAIFTGSYCGKKPIRHKRIFKSEKKSFSGYGESVLLRKQSTCLIIWAIFFPQLHKCKNRFFPMALNELFCFQLGAESGLFCSLDLFKNIKDMSFIAKHESALDHLLCWLHLCRQQKL